MKRQEYIKDLIAKFGHEKAVESLTEAAAVWELKLKYAPDAKAEQICKTTISFFKLCLTDIQKND